VEGDVKLDYGMVDADNHFYEPVDALTRYLPDARRRDVYWVTDDDRGHKHLVVGGRIWDYIQNPTFDPIVIPGLLDRRQVEPISNRPEYRDPAKRLARFDAQGIQASLMFPTLVNGLGEIVGGNLSLHVDLCWAFNQWLEDDWGFSYENRIFATPLFSLTDPDQSVQMLEWALDRGCRAVMVAAGPVRSEVGWRSPADPVYDPFWARLAEARVPACVHAAAHYNRHSGEYTGNFELRPMQDQTLDAIMNSGRAVSDFFAAMVWQGAFSRHPELRFVSIENKSSWVPNLVSRFQEFQARRFGAHNFVRSTGGTRHIDEDPVEAFHRCVYVTPHWEEDIRGLLEFLPVERVTAGSDFPHYDGLEEPTDYAKHLDWMKPEDQRKVMRDNLGSLLASV
jgi:predicted TIM-barrel fold metal-dependent hydrolase